MTAHRKQTRKQEQRTDFFFIACHPQLIGSNCLGLLCGQQFQGCTLAPWERLLQFISGVCKHGE